MLFVSILCYTVVIVKSSAVNKVCFIFMKFNILSISASVRKFFFYGYKWTLEEPENEFDNVRIETKVHMIGQ